MFWVMCYAVKYCVLLLNILAIDCPDISVSYTICTVQYSSTLLNIVYKNAKVLYNPKAFSQKYQCNSLNCESSIWNQPVVTSYRT